jgi:hypothetical protein
MHAAAPVYTGPAWSVERGAQRPACVAVRCADVGSRFAARGTGSNQPAASRGLRGSAALPPCDASAAQQAQAAGGAPARPQQLRRGARACARTASNGCMRIAHARTRTCPHAHVVRTRPTHPRSTRQRAQQQPSVLSGRGVAHLKAHSCSQRCATWQAECPPTVPPAGMLTSAHIHNLIRTMTTRVEYTGVTNGTTARARAGAATPPVAPAPAPCWLEQLQAALLPQRFRLAPCRAPQRCAAPAGAGGGRAAPVSGVHRSVARARPKPRA